MPVSIVRMRDAYQVNNKNAVTFYVDFAEAVDNVSADDFTLLGTGSGTIGNPIQVDVDDGDEVGAYYVTVTVSADGKFGLQLNDDTDIRTVAGGLPIDDVSMDEGEFWTVDRAAPTVTSVNAPANATYHAGDQVDFVVNFSEAVKVGTGTPTLGLTLDTGGAVNASLVAGQETSALTFRYTVASTDIDPTGVTLSGIFGGTLVDRAGNAATLTLAGVAPMDGVLVDGRPYVKTIDRVGAQPSASEVSYSVVFDQPVTGVSAADFTLTTTHGTATGSIAGVSGSGANYTVTVNDLAGEGMLRLDLVGGGSSIVGAGGGLSGGYAGGQSYTIDKVAPTITAVSMPVSATYAAGQGLDFTLHFNEDVTVFTADGTPRLEVTVGSSTRYATYLSGTPTAHVFRYVAAAGDLDTDGIIVGALDLNGGAIKDSFSNPAVLTLPTLASTAGVLVDGVAPTTVGTTIAFSNDTGASNSDLVTREAAQTLSGSLSAPLGIGESVLVSLNNGDTWAQAVSAPGATAWSLTGVLSGSGTLKVVVADAAGNKGEAYSHAYVIDQTAPSVVIHSAKLSADTGPSDTDFVTSTAAQTISGTLSTALGTDERLEVSIDNGATWSPAATSGTDWSLSGVTLSTSDTLKVRVTDLAGNAGTVLSRSYVVDTAAPTTAAASAAFSDDSGASGFDLITNVSAQTISGTLSANLAAGEFVEVSLDDGASWTTATASTGASTWSRSGAALSGSDTLTVRVVDLAGNTGATYSAEYILDTDAPTVAVTSSSAQVSAGGVATITFSFSEEVTGFSLADVTRSGGDLTGLTATADPKVFTAQFTASAANGSVSVTADAYMDIAGNLGGGQTFSFTPAPPSQPKPAPTPRPTADDIRKAFAQAAGFSVGSDKALPATIELADGSIVPNPAFEAAAKLAELIVRFEQNLITLSQLVEGVVALSAPTSGVSLQAYQFFTGSIPTEAGMAWLINSQDNPNDLTDPYYARFNEVNRFINFAVNLGLHGEGKDAFAAKFDALDFTAATRLAYDMIIGFDAARAAGVNVDEALAWIISQEGYFDAVAGSDLGGKAAMVGYIMQAGYVAQVGRYYEAAHDFIEAGFDGGAPYHVDLVGGQHLGA